MFTRSHLEILKSRMQEPRRTMQVVMGPRQIGKSTMIGQFANITTTPYNLFTADGVWKTNTSWISQKWHQARMEMDIRHEEEHILIIDEIQKILGWSEIVKMEWDRDTRENRNLKVILLGSSKLLIQKGLDESLAGRFETIKMGYWEWEEMKTAFGFTLDEYIYFGGFPGLAPYIHDEERWRKMMEDSIVSPILTKDIFEVEEIRNPSLFRQVFELASIYSGQEMSLTKMQGVVNNGTVPTVGSYLDIMDKTMLAKPLHKFEPSQVGQKNSVPKLQVYNNAFKNGLGTGSFVDARMDFTLWGRVVESAVGAHLANRAVIDGFDLLYWRTPEKKEVDFVLRKGEKLIAIEVKSGAAKDTRGYEAFKNKYAENICQAMIVGPEGLPLDLFFQLDIPELFSKNAIG
ncbi:MAG: AAA family ATPase [Bacteroidales bacterium]|nr:AAA family ATPase [Bacteroidales bacterium]